MIKKIFKGGQPNITTTSTSPPNIKQIKSATTKKIIITIVVIFLVLGIIVGVTYRPMSNYVREKKLRFTDERCTNSMTMLFPNLFGPPGTTFFSNKTFCDTAAMNDAHAKNIAPVQNQIFKQTQFINNITSQVQDTQKMVFHIRDSIEKQARDVQQKLYNLYYRLAFVFNRFRRLFYKIFTFFKSIFETLKYAVWTMQSMWNGPIGGLVRAFCFGEETLLTIHRNNEPLLLKISNIQLNDILPNNSQVIGICKFLNHKSLPYYKLHNIYVSGYHLVHHNHQIIRTHSHPEALPIEYDNPTIHCLITTDSKVKINDVIFCDYLGDNTLITYMKIISPLIQIKYNLNHYKNKALNLYPGFTRNSLIRTNNGVKKVEDLQLGENIYNKKILGIIQYQIEDKTFITKYENEQINGMLVGLQIFHNHSKYEIKEQEQRFILGKLECIGLLVEGSVIKLDEELEVVDFDIISDKLRMFVENELSPV